MVASRRFSFNGGASGGGGLSLSGSLVAQFKADTGVTTSGSDVTLWTSVEGNTQLGQVNINVDPPTFVASDPALNGQPCIQFDSANEGLVTTTGAGSPAIDFTNPVDGLTWVWVGYLNGSAGGDSLNRASLISLGNQNLIYYDTDDFQVRSQLKEKSPDMPFLFSDPSAVTSGQATFIALRVVENGICEMYVDGVLVASGETGDFDNTESFPLAIGYAGNTNFAPPPNDRTNTFAFGGCVAEVRAYTTALTSDEIRELSNEFATTYGTPAAPTRTPGDLPSCELWIRSDSGLTDSGGSVTQWDDLTGKYTFLPTSGNAPAYTASNAVVNNFPTADTVFFGTGMTTTTPVPDPATGLTLVWAGHTSAVTGSVAGTFPAFIATGTFGLLENESVNDNILGGTPGTAQVGGDNIILSGNNAYTDLTAFWIAYDWRPDDGVFRVLHNNVEVASGDPGDYSTFVSGAQLAGIGASGGARFAYFGSMAEGAIFMGPLDQSELDELDVYFRARYNIV